MGLSNDGAAVVHAKAGAQRLGRGRHKKSLGPRLRGDDETPDQGFVDFFGCALDADG
jgi:hypothetical protein